MARPAVHGLLKHQLYIGVPGDEAEAVLTFWTWRNEHPVPGARITYEVGAIEAWLTSHWKAITLAGRQAFYIRTWDFGFTPPQRVSSHTVSPTVTGTAGGSAIHVGLSALIALRTQAVGSSVRNRLNGRIFHPFVTTSLVQTDGTLTSGQQAVFVAAYTNLLGRLDPVGHADSGDWSVVSFSVSHAYRGTPLVLPIDHILTRNYLAQKHSRTGRFPPYAVGV